MANKAQIKALEDQLRIVAEISEARRSALQGLLQALEKRTDTLDLLDVIHRADLAARGMREGRTPSGNRLVEVAIGTPLACDPTSETYWSM